jgi:hypothetical protein
MASAYELLRIRDNTRDKFSKERNFTSGPVHLLLSWGASRQRKKILLLGV